MGHPKTSLRLGYTEEDLELVGAANIGEGCGNPLSFANISKGDTVVDLGSGAGIDCILAARLVGDGACAIVAGPPSHLVRHRALQDRGTRIPWL